MMENKRNLAPGAKQLINYTLPAAHFGKSVYVDFYQYDPVNQKMRRKKYCLNSIKSKSKQKEYARDLIARITEELRRGWNVWIGDSTVREHTEYDVVADLYVRSIKGRARKGVLKQSSCDRYIAHLKVWNEWLKTRAQAIKYVFQVDKTLIIDFLDHLFLDRDYTAVTRNNYLSWLTVYTEWMIEKKYLLSSPTEGIHKLKEEEKFREPLSKAMLGELQRYLWEKDKFFLLACMMLYYTLIRPEELTHLTLGSLHLAEQYVFVSKDWSKNKKDSKVALNKKLVKLMVDLGIFNYPSNYYLFGGKDFKPSKEKQDSRIFRDRWAYVRIALGWRTCYQFYSLKDSGIRDLANVEGIVTARNQARHSDIAITNIYLKHQDLKIEEGCKSFEGDL